MEILKPTITDFTNAQHDHSTNLDGGLIDHNNLLNLLGGNILSTIPEYYHLSEYQFNNLLLIGDSIPLTSLDINGATADTDPDDGDLAAIYSGDASTNRKITLANLKTYFQSGVASGAVTFNEPAGDNSAGTQAIFDSATVGESVAFPDLLYLKSDGKWWKADADSSTTMPGLRLALESKNEDQTCSMLVAGRVRDDDWTWTVGGIIYASTTGGGLTQTAPTGSGDIVQQVGIAYHADKMIFVPDMTQLEIV